MAEEYDEWRGVITLDVQMILRATTGRPKHTDPEEQGSGLAYLVETYLKRWATDEKESADVSIGTVRMTANRSESWSEFDQDPPDWRSGDTA